ncbi:MAG: hypothetical protein HY707_12170 [Ignavibacteriae bacterium]|nr:hypothetical protein [Ignavibacteriota bacterium]
MKRAFIFLLSLIFLNGCKKDDNSVGSTNKKFLITNEFSPGTSSVTGFGSSTSDATAQAITPAFDLTDFDSIEVNWVTSFSPFPSDTYEPYYRLAFGRSVSPSVTFYQKRPAAASESHSVILRSYQLPNRGNVAFFFSVSCGISPSPGVVVEIAEPTIWGWKR